MHFPYLEAIPQREAIKNRLTELWNFERYGLPENEGGRYFYERNDGLQNQDVVYVTDSLDGEPFHVDNFSIVPANPSQDFATIGSLGTLDAFEKALRVLANELYTDINEAGDI